MSLKKFIATLVLVGASVSAQASSYSFSCVTHNLAKDCATGASQLGLSVTENGSYVDFLFSNIGPQKSSITDIYFDWSKARFALSKDNAIFTSSPDVFFSWGANPKDLPGGGTFSANLGADSDSPIRPNGVNPDEWLKISFAGETFANVVASLGNGGLNVGLHVQGFQGGGSESFVLTPVPEPETYAMMLAGLGLMGFVSRRRRATAKA